jgi:hypothetical protein
LRQGRAGPVRNHRPLFVGQGGIGVQHERVRPQTLIGDSRRSVDLAARTSKFNFELIALPHACPSPNRLSVTCCPNGIAALDRAPAPPRPQAQYVLAARCL